MTPRARSVRALRDVRERQRDVAAAKHVHATTVHEHARRALSIEEQRLECFLDDAQRALASAQSIHDFDRVAESIDAHRLAIAEASEAHDSSADSARRSQLTLRDSARDLRVAETLVERNDHEVARREARHEQRAHDDLARRRR